MTINGTDGEMPAAVLPAGGDIAAGEESVARAEAAFSASLKDASQAGQEVALRVASGARPVLIAVGLLVATAIAVRLFTRSRAKRGVLAPSSPAAGGLSSEVGRAVVISFASVAGRWAAQRWLGTNRHSATDRLAQIERGAPSC